MRDKIERKADEICKLFEANKLSLISNDTDGFLVLAKAVLIAEIKARIDEIDRPWAVNKDTSNLTLLYVIQERIKGLTSEIKALEETEV